MLQRRHAHQPALYEHVLADFLADPADRKNLPRGGARRLIMKRRPSREAA
jgi:hypothetical protein